MPVIFLTVLSSFGKIKSVPSSPVVYFLDLSSLVFHADYLFSELIALTIALTLLSIVRITTQHICVYIIYFNDQIGSESDSKKGGNYIRSLRRLSDS